jgi:gliding motility-associated-like protein
MPTGFTANGDGLNDKFDYPDFIKAFSMKIYNRWGEVIFFTCDPYNGWDGTYKGRSQPVGNWLWVISLVDQNGSGGTYHGNVLLIR